MVNFLDCDHIHFDVIVTWDKDYFVHQQHFIFPGVKWGKNITIKKLVTILETEIEFPLTKLVPQL